MRTRTRLSCGRQLTAAIKRLPKRKTVFGSNLCHYNGVAMTQSDKIGDIAMNDAHKTGRRIVSKGEYARAQGRRFGLAADAICLFIVAGLCFVKAPSLCYILGETAAKWPSATLLLLLIPVPAIVIYALGKAAGVRLRTALTLDAGVPLTRANTGDLPAPESLVRAAEEPVQAQQAVLLRPSPPRHERQEEQLVRAVAGTGGSNV